METIFNRCGLPGCVASMDGVHVELGCAPARDKHLYVGKEGYPTVAFNVCVGHNLYIYSCSQAHYGARNDKTMATMDKYLKMVSTMSVCPIAYYNTCTFRFFIDVVVCLSMQVRNDPMYTDYTFDLQREDGSSFQAVGCWVLCDTGYHKWRQTICGFKRTSEPKRRAFAERCEAVRKDVERVFGIIKKRHVLVDSPVLLRDVQDVERVFKMCVVLHNMLLRYDGLDTIGQYEDDWKRIDRQLGMTQTPNGHGVFVGKCCVSDVM